MKFRRLWAVSLSVFLLAVLFFQTGQAVKADNNTRYGEDAVYYMEYIQRTYPQRIPQSSQDRAAGDWLKREIAAMGYQVSTENITWQGNDGLTYYGENIMFLKRGNIDREIVIGAHYDSVDTNGADDNASGVGLVLETANRIIDVETNYSVRFILFDLGEEGNIGSRYHVGQASPEYLDNIACYINLDTLAMGDSMYVYGGSFDGASISRTWLAEQAAATAEEMGLAIGFHPDVNAGYPVPTKSTGGDHAAFDQAGIPYLYMNASNWMGGNYDDTYQTSHEAVSDGMMKHRQAYDNWAFYSSTFPGRAYEHLSSYSRLLDRLIRNMVEWTTDPAVPEETSLPEEDPTQGTSFSFEKVNETVWTTTPADILEESSETSSIMATLDAGEPILRVGYNEVWSQVKYQGRELYMLTQYLTAERPEGAADLTEETAEEEMTVSKASANLESSQALETVSPQNPSADAATKASLMTAAGQWLSQVEPRYYWIGGIVALAVAGCVAVFIYQSKHRY